MLRKQLTGLILALILLVIGLGLAAAEAPDNNTFDVTQFGADGTDTEDDWQAIQAALNRAREADTAVTVTIPAGKYYISSVLSIYSNTVLDCTGATIVRSNPSAMMIKNYSKDGGSPGGYSRSKNITVKGGTWDGGTGAGDSGLFYFSHAEGIHISGVKMVHCAGHFVEFTAVKDSWVKSSSFSDFTGTVPEGSDNTVYAFEAVQIDFANQVNSSGSEPYDGTVCNGITVSGCTFTNCACGVGDHHKEDPNKKNIGLTFTNNTFTDIKRVCVNLYGVNGAAVKGNTVTGAEIFVIADLVAGDVSIEENTVSGVDRFLFVSGVAESLNAAGNTASGTGKSYGIHAVDSANVSIKENTLKGFMLGIRALRCTPANITGNKVSDIAANQTSKTSPDGIFFSDSTGDITGNTLTNCGGYNIYTRGTCSGKIEGNYYDLPYGIRESNGMTRGANHLMKDGKEIPEADGFTVLYHIQDGAEAAEQTTYVKYDETVATLKTSDLDFHLDGKLFIGWKVYRNDSRSFRVKDPDGKESWEEELPEGYTWALYPEGKKLKNSVAKGAELHLIAQWEDSSTFTVYYHKKDGAAANKAVTIVEYGKPTKTLDYQDLKFFTAGQQFTGWKVFRGDTKQWLVKDKKGNESWAETLPKGDSYVLYKNGCSVSDTVPAGMDLHLYAQWKKTKNYIVYYHPDDSEKVSKQTTTVKEGTKAKTLTREALGFYVKGKTFTGWKVYRADKKLYRVKDKSGKVSWQKELPKGSTWDLSNNGVVVGKVCQAGGELHLYAQWKKTDAFRVYYHGFDSAGADKQVTEVTYGKKTKILTLAQLGFSNNEKKFKGWKVYRSDTKKYLVKNKKGKESWAEKPPKGGSYALYKDGCTLSKNVPAGMDLHLYAQWE